MSREKDEKQAKQSLPTASDEPRQICKGAGACAKCNCREYEGSGWTCANAGCGHAYQDHW